MKLSNYIDALQSRGTVTFTRAEALGATGITSAAFYNSVSRLKKAGRLFCPRQGFYVIIRLEDKAAGGPPPTNYIHQLMEYLDLKYYIGLISAAAIQGAGHQAPQVLQVVTNARLRTIRRGRTPIQFFFNPDVHRIPIISLKIPAGYVRASTPEATAVDIVYYAKQSGGIDNVCNILIELEEGAGFDPDKLLRAAVEMHDRATAQRLGYLLDRLGYSRSASYLADWLSRREITPIPLLASGRRNNVLHNRRWQVLINHEISPDILPEEPA